MEYRQDGIQRLQRWSIDRVEYRDSIDGRGTRWNIDRVGYRDSRDGTWTGWNIETLEVECRDSRDEHRQRGI